jgi:hypothetical protein
MDPTWRPAHRLHQYSGGLPWKKAQTKNPERRPSKRHCTPQSEDIRVSHHHLIDSISAEQGTPVLHKVKVSHGHEGARPQGPTSLHPPNHVPTLPHLPNTTPYSNTAGDPDIDTRACSHFPQSALPTNPFVTASPAAQHSAAQPCTCISIHLRCTHSPEIAHHALARI